MKSEYKLTILVTLLLTGVIIDTVQAQETEIERVSRIFCSSNDTLAVNLTETRCIDDQCKVHARINEEYCPNGCDSVTNRCSPNAFNRMVYYVIPIFAGFFMVLFIVLRLTRRQ